jgi:hypothetical protein
MFWLPMHPLSSLVQCVLSELRNHQNPMIAVTIGEGKSKYETWLHGRLRFTADAIKFNFSSLFKLIINTRLCCLVVISVLKSYS